MKASNFRTINSDKDAESRNWCISLKEPKVMQQVTIEFNDGKTNQYASRFEVTEEDLAIVGKNLDAGRDDYFAFNDKIANTGQMGRITEALDRLEIPHSKSGELDFVFTSDVKEENIYACYEYIETLLEDFKEHKSYFYPISHWIRELLAAISILSYPKLSSKEDQEIAQEIINKKYDLAWIANDATYDIYLPESSFEDIHIATYGKEKEELEKPPYSDRKALEKFAKKYVQLGAISIMARGGLFNLLKTYLALNPDIDEYYDELMEHLEFCHRNKTMDLLKGYK